MDYCVRFKFHSSGIMEYCLHYKWNSGAIYALTTQLERGSIDSRSLRSNSFDFSTSLESLKEKKRETMGIMKVVATGGDIGAAPLGTIYAARPLIYGTRIPEIRTHDRSHAPDFFFISKYIVLTSIFRI